MNAVTADMVRDLIVGQDRARPQDLHDRLADGGYRPARITKALGKYMARYQGRWTALGYTIRKEKRRDDPSKNAWRVERRGSSPLSPLLPNDPADGGLSAAAEGEEFSSDSSSCERPDSNGMNGKRGTVFFDLETCSADRLWTTPPRPVLCAAHGLRRRERGHSHR